MLSSTVSLPIPERKISSVDLIFSIVPVAVDELPVPIMVIAFASSHANPFTAPSSSGKPEPTNALP